jgi:hypothetical protein
MATSPFGIPSAFGGEEVVKGLLSVGLQWGELYENKLFQVDGKDECRCDNLGNEHEAQAN